MYCLGIFFISISLYFLSWAFGWTTFDLYRTSYICLHLSTRAGVFFCISLIRMYFFLIFGGFLYLGPSWTTFNLCLCWQPKSFFWTLSCLRLFFFSSYQFNFKDDDDCKENTGPCFLIQNSSHIHIIYILYDDMIIYDEEEEQEGTGPCFLIQNSSYIHIDVNQSSRGQSW